MLQKKFSFLLKIILFEEEIKKVVNGWRQDYVRFWRNKDDPHTEKNKIFIMAVDT